jgi:polysaccharide pyruvyl transferase WcaK-like protein
MTHICLWGTSLQKVADEAQFLAMLQLIEHAAPGAKVTIFARPREDSLIPRSVRNVSVIPTASLPGVIRNLKKSSLLVMVGGCFMENVRQAAVCALLVALARFLRTPVIAIGVTAFPYRRRWGRYVYRRIFNAMGTITVREAAAEAALQALNIKTSMTRFPDPRYILSTDNEADISGILKAANLSKDRPAVGITLRYLHDDMPEWVKVSHDYSPDAVDATNAAIARMLDELAAVAQLFVLPMHPTPGEDSSAATEIRRHMHNPQALHMVSGSIRAPQLAALIKWCDVLIASRLAAGMFAASAGTPFIGIAYEERLAGLMTSLGLREFVFPWRQVDADQLSVTTARVWKERVQLRETIRAAAKPLVAAAWANAQPVSRFIR